MANEHGQVRDEQLDAEARVRRLAALGQIRQYPDPVLCLRARAVERFDADLERVVARMTLLMDDARGVGLAGNQIGLLQRLFVFELGEEGPTAVVNPRVVARSEELEVDEEGCLSLRGVLVPVERNVGITLAGFDPSGAPLELELTGLPARVAQHELDHLDGVLIIDRTDRESRREALAALRPQPVLELS